MAAELRSLFRELCEEWGRRISAARDARKDFMRTAAVCVNFYQGANGFMWDQGFRSKFFSSLPAPDFKITINKAFELVSIVGPSLFWDYPGRVIKPVDQYNLTPEALGNPSDPQIAAQFQALMQQREYEMNRRKTAHSLMENYLNYSQREQPFGGLRLQSRMAIVEALVTGRGVLQVEPYSYPGSNRILTQAKYVPVSRLFIDPDCKKPDLSDCGWVAIQHVEPHWMVERRFGLEGDSLRGKCSQLSFEEVAQNEFDDLSLTRKSATTHDLIVWYEVFSKCGAGTRGKKRTLPLHEAFEEVVGDYAYICYCPGMDEFLNLPADGAFGGWSDKEIRDAMSWPYPAYMDHRWPVCLLDFYPSLTGPWPIAPLSPGLGILIFMNVMISALCSRVYHSSRNIVAVLKSATDDVIKKVKAGEFNEFIELNPSVQRSIQEVVSFLQTPQVNPDVFQMLDRLAMMFDKNVGLTDALYGMHAGGKVSRSAADATYRQEAVNIRPEDMANCVENWQTEVANVERLCAGWHVRGSDVEPRFGSVGAMLWDDLIANEDPELFVRTMQCTVEANSIRRPNKARDNANLTQMSGYILPILSSHAQMSGDNKPLNSFMRAIGSAMEQDVSGWLLPEQAAMPQNQAGIPPTILSQEPPPDVAVMEG